jgi:hypothetical protein
MEARGAAEPIVALSVARDDRWMRVNLRQTDDSEP